MLSNYIFYDPGTATIEFEQAAKVRNYKPEDTFARARYQKRSKAWVDEVVKVERNIRLPWIHKREEDVFHSSKILP